MSIKSSCATKSGASSTPPLIDVYVKLPTGRTSVQHLRSADFVGKIYENVAVEEGVPVDRVRIKYTGKVLKRSDTIGYKGICKETVLKGEIIIPKEMPVIIKDEDGHSIMVTVSNVDSIERLKEAVYSKEGHPIFHQSLIYGGRLLTPDSQSLMDAGVTAEAVINLKLADPAAAAACAENTGATNKEEGPGDERALAILNSFSSDGKPVEVVFSFDTTGSMYSCLAQVRSKLREACARLLRDIPNIRIGIMAQGDYCDQDSTYVVRSLDLTTDVDGLCDFAQNVPATGGGDSPECYEWVLRKAQQLDWSEDSAKALVVIGDCEPHPPSYTDQRINWHEELDLLIGMNIKVYGVQAQENSTVKPFYEELAERSGGCYINFRDFYLITDMFLAVCYKESSAEQLEAFCEEVREDGRMTAETQAMFTQLEGEKTPETKSTSADRSQSSRYVRVPWWDPQLDAGQSPRYRYLTQTDRWEQVSRMTVSPPAPAPAPHPIHTVSAHSHTSTTRRKISKNWKKRGCEVM